MSKTYKVHELSIKEFIDETKLFIDGKYKEINLTSANTKSAMKCVVLQHYKSPAVYIVLTSYAGEKLDRWAATAMGATRMAEYISYTASRVVSENIQMAAAAGDRAVHEFSWEFILSDENEGK